MPGIAPTRGSTPATRGVEARDSPARDHCGGARPRPRRPSWQRQPASCRRPAGGHRSAEALCVPALCVPSQGATGLRALLLLMLVHALAPTLTARRSPGSSQLSTPALTAAAVPDLVAMEASAKGCLIRPAPQHTSAAAETQLAAGTFLPVVTGEADGDSAGS